LLGCGLMASGGSGSLNRACNCSCVIVSSVYLAHVMRTVSVLSSKMTRATWYPKAVNHFLNSSMAGEP
jgi:hypothetical protein